MFGLTMDKLVLVAVIAAFVIGPQRLPAYAAKLGAFVRQMRQLASAAQQRVQDELGPDIDVDWQKLDPRQYDPRRIIQAALLPPTESPAGDQTPPNENSSDAVTRVEVDQSAAASESTSGTSESISGN